jgi:hypothetical protein
VQPSAAELVAEMREVLAALSALHGEGNAAIQAVGALATDAPGLP